jgi:hypothetical protein
MFYYCPSFRWVEISHTNLFYSFLYDQLKPLVCITSVTNGMKAVKNILVALDVVGPSLQRGEGELLALIDRPFSERLLAYQLPPSNDNICCTLSRSLPVADLVAGADGAAAAAAARAYSTPYREHTHVARLPLPTDDAARARPPLNLSLSLGIGAAMPSAGCRGADCYRTTTPTGAAAKTAAAAAAVACFG